MTLRSTVSPGSLRSITRAITASALDFSDHPFCHVEDDDGVFGCRDCSIQFEVAREFAPLCGNPWERVERWYFSKIQRGFRKLAEVRDWQRSTTWGRARERASQRERDALARTRRVTVSCSLCGGKFSIQEINIKKSKSNKRVCQQCRTRNSMGKPITIDGRSKTLTEWARDYGMVPSTAYYRIRSGMTIVEALTKPLVKGRQRVKVAE